MANVLKLAVALAFVSILVSAIPQIPESYSGKAYIGGSLAPIGSQILARSASGDAWDTTVATGAGDWTLDIILDDVDTSNDEGAGAGEQISWYIGETKATLVGMADDTASSGNVNTDVVLYTGNSPTTLERNTPETTTSLTPSVSSTSTSLLSVQETSTVRSTTTVEAPQLTTVPGPLANLLSFRRVREDNPSNVSGGTQPGSCFDGVRNEGEEAVDCGGACQPCKKSDSTLWYILAGVLALGLFLVFTLFLLFVVYSLAKKHRK